MATRIAPAIQPTQKLREQVAIPGIRIPGRLTRLEQGVVINFDDVADGAPINTHYPGVTLATVLPGQAAKGPVYARKIWDQANPSNVMSPLAPTAIPAFDDGSGFIEVSFSKPTRQVSIDALALAFYDLRPVTSKPYLEAYDAGGKRIARVVYPPKAGDAAWGTWQRLEFTSGATDIVRLHIGSERSSTSSPVYGMFDQLSYKESLV